ncbi:mismatch-specific DNA-glycosylase [Nocardioides nanhaiensis]|uniref:G/U mismatch-specific DNA glycosylase n=1 Tax=Nocardioides nanhaiensis TaxID=1476871 RepID=A0ABP8W6I7_9ACTN
MEILPDVVGPAPRIVFCGMAGAQSPRSREHRYDSPGNDFWRLMHLSGLVPRGWGPAQEGRLPELGLGTTDLVRHRGEGEVPDRHEVPELVARVEQWAPDWLAFTSKTVAAVVARHLGERRPLLGPADWTVGPAQVFCLPGSSGANRRRDYDGRPDRLSWWITLAEVAGFESSAGR